LGFNGWDTYANEGGADARLARLVTGFSDTLAAFEHEKEPFQGDRRRGRQGDRRAA